MAISDYIELYPFVCMLVVMEYSENLVLMRFKRVLKV